MTPYKHSRMHRCLASFERGHFELREIPALRVLIGLCELRLIRSRPCRPRPGRIWDLEMTLTDAGRAKLAQLGPARR